MRNWRIFACGLAAASLASGAPTAPESLRDSAQRAGFLVGAAVRPEQLSEAAYSTTLAREFNLLQPEDAMKWEVVHPDPQTVDFAGADRIVAFAIAHQMKIRGHTLVWHQQNPQWLAEGRYTPGQLAHILEQHIKTVVGHYRGKVFAWDVVNEALDENVPVKLRSTIWYDAPGIGYAQQGYSYIAQCFRWAHAADPQALLFYNEAETEEMNSKSNEVYALIREFKRQGVPIDGVGFQMHIRNLHTDIASIDQNIGRFAALGVQVQITEMDVALPVDANGHPTPQDLKRQADIYSKIAAACLSHPGCTAIQTWGFTDRYSWIGSHSRHTQGAALLFDANYRPKPAYEALQKAFLAFRPAVH